LSDRANEVVNWAQGEECEGALISTSVTEIRRYRQTKALAEIERISM